MGKYRVISLLLMTVLMGTAAFSQENPKKDQTKTVSGTVSKIDFVGGTISILAMDGRLISFFVPDNAIIVRDTKNIGLMDIKEGHPVTIQYNISSPGKDIIYSIVDNKPTGNE